MSEWKNGRLADLAAVKAGYSFRSSEFTDTGRRLIKISNIQNSNVCVQENDVFISNNPSYTDFDLHENEVLIALSGATTGKVGKIKKDVLPAYLNQRVGKYEANAGGTIDFIYYVVTSSSYFNFILNNCPSSAQPNVSPKFLESIPVTFPTALPEQRKIARILSTVDAVIEKTEVAIAKYKAIKSGMMRDLFTRGIDIKTGNLRPSHEDAPELYKESELGWVPKEWEVKKFEDITSILTCGVASTPKYVNPDVGIPFLSAQNVQLKGIVLEKFSYISKEFHKELTKNNRPSFGDILYSRVGAGYGQAAVVNFDWEFSVYVSLTLIRMRKDYSNYFYSHLLNSKPYKDKASINVFYGGGVPNLNVNEVRVFDMICPKYEEQTLIAEKVNCITATIDKEEMYLNKYQQLKQALMSDLLTGKVRVNYEEQKAEAM